MKSYAPPLKRFAAFLIDWYLSSLIGSIPVIIIQSLYGKDLVILNSLENLPLSCAWIAGLLALFCHFLYYCYFPSRKNRKGISGQTIGMQMMHLQFLTAKEAPVSLGTLTVRHMLLVIVFQGYLTSSHLYLISLFQMTTGLSVTAYMQFFNYIVILVSLVLYFVSGKKQLLQDCLTKVTMYSV